MKRLNKKGFTLVELIATILILALVMGIGSYSIIGIMNSAKEKDYELLIENINDAAELYYQECKYSASSVIDTIDCDYEVTLGNLVTYGYLKGNTTNDDNYKIVNPSDGGDISSCIIVISYSSKISVDAKNPTGSCPLEY